MLGIVILKSRCKLPGVELSHNNLEAITGCNRMTLCMRHEHFEPHSIPEKLVRVTRGKAGLAHTYRLNNTAATQLLKHLEKMRQKYVLSFKIGNCNQKGLPTRD